MSWIWAVTVVLGVALVVLIFLAGAALTWHVQQCRRQARTEWACRYPPLPTEPLPPLDVEPDGLRDDPGRLPFR